MKWITALNLQQWAATLSARAEFPALIADLVRASASDIAAFRFPSGDKGQVRGFDGALEAAGSSSPYVPAGASIWEFGLQEIQGKFEKDISKRDALDAKERLSTTFVFASAYTWDNPKVPLPTYIEEQKALHKWKDILIVDGPQLEAWLESCPAVAARYARFELNLVPQEGARSTDEFWDEYSHRYQPQLTEEVLLSGREKSATDLVQGLMSGQNRIRLAADSPDEVIAFAIAAIRKSDTPIRLFLESRALVVDTAEAARQLKRQDRIFLPRAQAAPVSGLLAAAAPTVLGIGRDQPNGEHVLLARPPTYVLAKSIETMGFNSDRALDLARRSGRSITILERQIPSGNAVTPPWMAKVRQIMPAILAGGWDVTRDADLKALGVLTGFGYDGLDQACREHAALQDPPIDLEGSIWKVRAPVDAFVHAGRHVTSSDLEALAAVCNEVFSQTVAPPREDDLIGSLTATDQPYSSWLRDGLATTLLQVAVLHTQAGVNVPGVQPQQWVNTLVANLPGLSEDPRLIASLRHELPLLVEAAPDPLLSALEQVLEGNEAAGALFWRRDGMFGPTSPHVYVLWALERLAWDPRRLKRVALLIAKMASVGPTDLSGNSPIGSLRSIFLPWNPQTYASLAERFRVVDRIADTYPKVGWDLIMALLPQAHSTNVPTSKPRFRDVEPVKPEILTRHLVWQGYQAAIDRVLSKSDGFEDRLVLLLNEVPNWPDEDIERLLILVERLLSTGANVLALWTKLRDLSAHHKTFEEADWALSAKWQDRIQELITTYQPTSVLDRVSWLFDKYWVEVPGPYLEREELTAGARAEAVNELMAAGGDESVLELVDKVDAPETVAYGLATAFPELQTAARLFERALQRQSDNALRFAEALSWRTHVLFPGEWPARLRSILSGGLFPSDAKARTILRWEDTPQTWDFATSLGNDVSATYWRLKPAFQFDGAVSDLHEGLARYLAAGRPSAALSFSHKRLADLEPATIVQMLYDLIDEVNSRGEDTNLTVYLAKEAISHLAERDGITTMDVARLEYAYLPVLGNRRTPLNIDRVLASDPQFYVDLIASVFRADDEPPEESAAPSDAIRAKWRADYTLLSDFQLVPGLEGSEVNYESLRQWVSAVRDLARQVKRLDIADQYIGHVLAHSPNGAGGAWPHTSVCRIVDEVESSSLEQGFQIECHNKRGVYHKDVHEGGGQERALALQYRDWAALAAEFPRMAALLEAVAASWEQDADREDVRARQDMMRD